MNAALEATQESSNDLAFVNTEPTGSGKTEVHILNGADNFSTFLLHTAAILGYTDPAKHFLELTDWNWF